MLMISSSFPVGGKQDSDKIYLAIRPCRKIINCLKNEVYLSRRRNPVELNEKVNE